MANAFCCVDDGSCVSSKHVSVGLVFGGGGGNGQAL